jgi:hypothetical protein
MKLYVPRLILAAGVLVLFCAAARADDPRLQSINASWDDSKNSSDDWPVITFADENSTSRTVFIRLADINRLGAVWEGKQTRIVGFYIGHTDHGDTIPLFNLNEISGPPGQDADSKVHYYQAVLSPYVANVNITGNAQTYSGLPPEYAFTASVVRPGSALNVQVPAFTGYPGRGLRQTTQVQRNSRRGPYNATVDAGPYEMVVLRPSSSEDAKWSPFTALPNWPDTAQSANDRWLDRDGKTWDYAGDPVASILHSFLPEEIEIARAAGLTVTDAGSPEVAKVQDQVENAKNRAGPYLYAAAQRPAIRSAAEHAQLESANASPDAFTPFEFKFLVSRAADLGRQDSRKKLTAAVPDKKALARVRRPGAGLL